MNQRAEEQSAGPKSWVLYNNDNIYPIELINQMSLEAGALTVEWLIVWKGSTALWVTMATKRVPTTQHCHTERAWNGIVTTTHTHLSGDERSGSKTNRYHRLWTAVIRKDQQSKTKQSWDMQSHGSPSKPSGHPAQTCLPGAQLLTH